MDQPVHAQFGLPHLRPQQSTLNRFDPSITCCCAGWGFGSLSVGIDSPPDAPPTRSRALPAVSSRTELAPQSPPPAQWALSLLEHFLALMFYCSPNVKFLQGVLSRLAYLEPPQSSAPSRA